MIRCLSHQLLVSLIVDLILRGTWVVIFEQPCGFLLYTLDSFESSESNEPSTYYFVHQMFVLVFRTGGCRTQCLLHAVACLSYYFVHQMFVLLVRTGVCRTQCMLHAFACLSYYFVHQMVVLLFRTGGCRTQCMLHAFACLSYYFVHPICCLVFRTGVCRTPCLLHAFACLSHYFVHQMFVYYFALVCVAPNVCYMPLPCCHTTHTPNVCSLFRTGVCRIQGLWSFAYMHIYICRQVLLCINQWGYFPL
jgi:hypothetical protein